MVGAASKGEDREALEIFEFLLKKRKRVSAIRE